MWCYLVQVDAASASETVSAMCLCRAQVACCGLGAASRAGHLCEASAAPTGGHCEHCSCARQRWLVLAGYVGRFMRSHTYVADALLPVTTMGAVFLCM